jgi:IS1 family transposase
MFAGHGSVLSWVFGVGALAIVVLGYLASINGTPGCDEASCYLSRLPRRVKNDDVASAVAKHKHEFGSIKIPKLVTVSDASGQPYLQAATFMLLDSFRSGEHRGEYPIASRKEYLTDVRLADHRIITRIALPLVDRIHVIRHDKIGRSPNIGGRNIAVVLSPDDIRKACVAGFVNIQRRSLNGFMAFVKTHERTKGQPRLGLHLFELPIHILGLTDCLFNQVIGLLSTGYHLGELLFHGRSLLLHDPSLYAHSLPLESHVAARPLRLVSLTRHDLRLSEIDDHLTYEREELQESDKHQKSCESLDFPLYLYIAIGVGCGGLNFGGWMLVIGRRKWRLLGYLALVVSSVALLTDLGTFAFGTPLAFWHFRWLLGKDDNCKYQPLHNGQIVSQKHLTAYRLCNTVSLMASVLSAEKQTAIIAALAEGSSIRSIERITGVHRDTIMRLGVKVGQGCTKLMDSKMQDLDCNYLQFDELWGFIGKKERHCSVDDNPTLGDVWTFCAIDSETKLVPSFKVGKRTHATTTEFVQDVARRMRHRVQVSSDAMHLYVEAMELAFGSDVDYGQCVKVYAHDAAQHPERKYSAPHFASAYRRPITGNPEMELVSTSHVERLNATTRLHMRRLTRLTLAFSKKLENFEAAVGLHFAYYNFVKRHNTLRCTPAMAAGVERDFWSVGDLVEAAA